MSAPNPRRRLLALLAGLLLAAPHAHASDPDALWKIVHEHCVPEQSGHASPKPCVAVSLLGGEPAGWVVLKDRVGATQFLLLPTAKITGIEDPAVLAPAATNYWQAAWDARDEVQARAGHELPRDVFSLAVNSPAGRTQNQLHIHIDCIRADVRAALRAAADRLGADWAPLGVPLAGHAYLARRVEGAELGETNPFRLLADAPEFAAAGIGQATLVVAGATFSDVQPGFVLLADRADPATGDRGNGEELQDHDCALAHMAGD